jgi:hypothetical protein
MFEDETIVIACPKCSFKNSILVREFEQTNETHIVCQGCQVGVRVEASEFRERLHQISDEVETMRNEAEHERLKTQNRPRKGDFQI